MPPDQCTLPLPSSIAGALTKPQLKALVSAELEVRQGQANDALAELRLAIAHKSFLYRQHRQVSGYRKVLRSYADIRSLASTVNHWARVYTRSRQALISLGASDEIMSRYQVLQPTDLAASTTLITPNVRGQRNASLSWIWRGESQSSDINWMKECAWRSLLFQSIYMAHITRPSLSCNLPEDKSSTRSLG